MRHGPDILSRRGLLAAGAALLALPRSASAAVREITWDELIPPGVPYSEIVGPGYTDEATDTWRPEFDANGIAFNGDLEGRIVKLPGYVIPMETGADGMTEFILVPYVGACIHVPPPPPNQLVYVTTDTPWPSEDLWEAIWVTGLLTTGMQTTAVAEIGYRIAADTIEVYEW